MATQPTESDIRSLGPQKIAHLVLADLEDIEGGYAHTEPIEGLIAAVRNLCFAVIEQETRYPEGFHRG
jgi:hypothetical protein